MTDLKIISVVDDFNCYNKTIKKNPYMNKYDLVVFDNTKKNIGISKRYNSYIKKNIFTNKVKDSWLVFCHQDFGFIEDILIRLEEQSKDCIYGVIGVKLCWRFAPKLKYIKNFLFRKIKKSKGFLNQGFDSKKYIIPNKKYFKNNKSFSICETWKFNLINNEIFMEFGKFFKKAKEVNTLDCCCLIVHSSLIKKYKLLFDENLDWHCYGEDFCLNAKYKHKIKTKVIYLNCFHLSEGNVRSERLKNKLNYLKNKYKGKNFVGTCFE